MTAVCMIYGATGHTGRLIVNAALERGLRPVIAGRNAQTVRSLADRHQLPFRSFPLDDPAAIADALEDVDVLLNAAGPAPAGAAALAQACIEAGIHYLDTACGHHTPERLLALDEAARTAGVTVLPGAGFSPAAAEALALHLKRRLPRAVRLVIALSTAARPTAGLIRTGFGVALRPSRALRRGRLKTMGRRRMRRFDFGRGPEPCYGLGWGELAAIHRATGVRNVDFFVRVRPDLARLIRLPALAAALRGLPPVRRRLEAFAAAHGVPAQDVRKPSRSRLVGFAYDTDGQRAASRIHLPDPYTVTAGLAVSAMMRAMNGPAAPGVLTATRYLGADVLAGLPGLHVDWEELELSAPGEVKLRVRRHGRRFPFGPAPRRHQAKIPSSRPEGNADGPVTAADAVGALRAAALAGRNQGAENGRTVAEPDPGTGEPHMGQDGAKDAGAVRRTGTG
jgi:short subunit dehydrogenase-like uncharacterized protein